MFERYTEKARRVIFFARHEASASGSPYIETEHMLLGLLREDAALSTSFFHSPAAPETLRAEIARQRPPGPTFPTSVDLPLSHESKRVLAYAAEEAERLKHHYIGTEHLLLGLLREKKTLAAQLLARRGVTAEAVRTRIQDKPPVPARRMGDVEQTTSLERFRLLLNVANLEASQAFYSKLGFSPVSGRNRLNSVVLANGRCVLALYQGQFPENLLSFETDDLASVASRLQSAGLSFQIPPSAAPDGSTAALLRDPDGNAIRLVQAPQRP
jgi:hypothetical protein